jgi:solute:Na+ symporter, SSS family
MGSQIGPLDWAVLIAALVAAVGVGLSLGRRQTTLETFFLGDRALPWWAILGSIVATETSTATVLSVPGHGLDGTGLRFLQLPLGMFCGRLLVVWLLLPLFFRGQLSSAYQVLRVRFGLATSQAAAGLFLLTRNLGDGLRLYLAALVIHQMLGWSIPLGCVVVGTITMVYTVFGGMRSIVWNDCLQWFIYTVGGVVSLLVIIWLLPEGWATVWQHGQQQGKWQWIDGRWDQSYNLWGGVLGGMVLSMGTHGTDHMMVQRYLSATSQRAAGWALAWSGVVVFAQFALFVVIGIALASFYESGLTDQPRPLKSDQVFSHFILHVFPKNTGLVGLMLAAIFAASMSTLSSSLNASASSVVHDFWLPRSATATSPSLGRQLWVTRGLTVVFGMLQIGIGIQAQYLAASVIDNSLRLAGFSGGLLLGLFLLGITTRQVGQTAALVAVSSAAVCLGGLELLGPIWNLRVGVPWLAFMGTAITMGVGWGGQVCLGRRIPQRTLPP